MNENEGRAIGQNALDAVAIAEEHSPGCELLAVQTTLVILEENGSIRVLNVTQERSRLDDLRD